ncbi:MAG: hypothetical protein RL701_6121, partial [Pseudomonadota bacterium]
MKPIKLQLALILLAVLSSCDDTTQHTSDDAVTEPDAAPRLDEPAYPDVVPNTAHDAPVELDMEAGEIPAGSERYLCKVFGNPFGKDV